MDFLVAIALSTSFPPPDTAGMTNQSSFTVSARNHQEKSAARTGDGSLTSNSGPETYSTSELACSQTLPFATVCQDAEAAHEYLCNSVTIIAPYEVNTYRREDGAQLSSEIVQLPCNPETPEPTARPAVVSVTARDFQQLDLTSSPLTILPNDGDLYVNLPIYLNTNAEPQTLDTELLGTPVSIKATPTKFSWDYGDGTTKAGTTPGATYPDETYAHTYKTPGTYTITLTTSWTGEYSTDGGDTWTPIDGTATTTSTSSPLQVDESIPLLTK